MIMYKRVMLKLSGEMFGSDSAPFDFESIRGFARALASLQKSGVQTAVVIGAGNIWRHRDFTDQNLDRVTSDNAGMVATVINALALSDAIERIGAHVSVFSALPVEKVVSGFEFQKARMHLEKGRIVILAGGTGHPYFTTDTAAALRACELKCDVFLKATKVDGVYDSDPVSNPNAKKFEVMGYDEVLNRELGVMDLTAVTLLRQEGIPIRVFDISDAGNLQKVVKDAKIGTTIS